MYQSTGVFKVANFLSLIALALFTVSSAMNHEDIRLALLGLTGSGKSTTGNLLLNKESRFKTSGSSNSETSECSGDDVKRDGRNVRVVDTPGFLDTDLTFSELQERIIPFLGKTAPGPHALLYVMEAGRFTEEQVMSMEMYMNMFGDGILNYTIVVLTKLAESTTEMDYMRKPHPRLQHFLEQCGLRYIFLPSPAKTSQMNIKIETLYEMIDKMMVANNGAYYTNDMFKAQQKILEEMLEEERQREIRENEEKINKIKTEVSKEYKEKLTSLQNDVNLSNEERQREIRENEEKINKSTKNIRLALLGLTGSGKSTTGNLLLNKESRFKTSGSSNSETSECSGDDVKRDGRNVRVVDTPEFLDTDLTFSELQERIIPFLGKTAPGPHALLYVMEAGRFTEEQVMSMEMYMNMFGDGILNYTIVVLTKLAESTTEMDYMRKPHPRLQHFLEQCGLRYIFLPSPAKTSQMNIKIETLYEMIDKMMVANNGAYYTNDMFKAQQKILEEMLEEERQREIRENEEKINKIKTEVSKEYKEKLTSLQNDVNLSNEERQREIRENEEKINKSTKNIRLALLGLTGSGKSTTGNLLLNKESRFKTSGSSNSETSECSGDDVKRDGRNVRVVDTPEFLDTDLTFSELQERIIPFLGKTAPGPHALLYVMEAGRFTEEQVMSMEMYMNMFGDGILNYTIVVLTKLAESTTEMDYMRKPHPRLQHFLEQCGLRYIFLPSPAKTSQMNIKIETLYEMIDKMMVANNGAYYTNDMFKAQQKILEEMLEEERQREIRENEEKINKIKTEVSKEYREKLTSLQNDVNLSNEERQREIRENEEKINKSTKNIRLALLGLTGSGKSTTGNLLLNKESRFKTSGSSNSETSECSGDDVKRDGRNVRVVDTPGFLDTDLTFSELQERIIPFLGKTAPGPHALLYVMEAGRFTEEQVMSMEMYMNMFGDGILNYTIVVLTKLAESTTEMDYMRKPHPRLQHFLEQCGLRYIFLPSPAKTSQMNIKIETLYEMIDKMMVANNGAYYTNDMFKAQQKILEEMLEEERQREIRENEEKINKIKTEVSKEYKEKLTSLQNDVNLSNEERQREIRENEEKINKIKTEVSKEYKEKLTSLQNDVNLSNEERMKEEANLQMLQEQMTSYDETIKNLKHTITLGNQRIQDLSRKPNYYCLGQICLRL